MVLPQCTEEVFWRKRLFHYFWVSLSHVASHILKPWLVKHIWWRGTFVNFRFQCFLNQLITFAVFSYSFIFNASHSLEFNWSKICLLILRISFSAGLMSLAVGWFKKLALLSFKVIKQFALLFTLTLSSFFAFLAYLIPLQFILLDVSFLDF